MSYTRSCCCEEGITGCGACDFFITKETPGCKGADNCSTTAWRVKESPLYGGAGYINGSSLCDLPASWKPPTYRYTGYMTLQFCCEDCDQIGVCCYKRGGGGAGASTCECLENSNRCDCLNIGGVWDASGNCATSCRGTCYKYDEDYNVTLTLNNLTQCECNLIPSYYSYWSPNPGNPGSSLGNCNSGRGNWTTVESWTVINGGPVHFFQDYKSQCLDCP